MQKKPTSPTNSQLQLFLKICLTLVILALAAWLVINRPDQTSAPTTQSQPTGEGSAVSSPSPVSTDQPPASDFALTDTQQFTQDYPGVGNDHLFVYRTGPEIVDILSHGTGVVFLGFKECDWCQAYAPLLNQTAQAAGLEKIYYFDIRQDRSDNTPLYQEIVALLGDNLDYDEEGQPRIFVPDVTFVKNGEILGHNNDTSMNTVAANGTPTEYWTPDRIATLQAELATQLEPLKGSACSETGAECN